MIAHATTVELGNTSGHQSSLGERAAQMAKRTSNLASPRRHLGDMTNTAKGPQVGALTPPEELAKAQSQRVSTTSSKGRAPSDIYVSWKTMVLESNKVMKDGRLGRQGDHFPSDMTIDGVSSCPQ